MKVMAHSPRGRLEYLKDGKKEEILFLYPMMAKWGCLRCGNCCRDVIGHERRILLTENDLKRIKDVTGLDDFFDETGEEPFKAIMKKKNGDCIFLREEECSIYDSRALLCRMYPFWIEKINDEFIIKIDEKCKGVEYGEVLDEEFFQRLLEYALLSMGY
jgi:Fe-S-cluster containining protein